MRYRGTSWRRRGGGLLLADGLQHVAGLGDVGEVNLGLDTFDFTADRARRFGGCGGLAFGAATKMGTDLLRLVLFQRTGVGFLLGDTYFRKNVENRLAFYFQLPGQIVDSNLAHPRLVSSTCPLSLHINLTELISVAAPR